MSLIKISNKQNAIYIHFWIRFDFLVFITLKYTEI